MEYHLTNPMCVREELWYELWAAMVSHIHISVPHGIRAGAVLVREPAEGVIRRRDHVAREARITSAVPVRVITVRFLLEIR